MRRYVAPAKVNLSLHVSPPRDDGYHPIESLVQTVDLLDHLELESSDEDRFEVVGDHQIDPDDDLVMRSLRLVRAEHSVPPVSLRLEKVIPSEAGLGGGSSDAAATLMALAEVAQLESGLPARLAPSLGADVRLFLLGGTLLMTGIGETLERVPPPTDFAVALAVPQFGLATSDVYRRWDEMEGPTDNAVQPGRLPPSLRDGMPIRNDLLPAALDLEPRLGDFMADLRGAWGTAVLMTGSGSACFSLFADVGEADGAAQAVSAVCRFSAGVTLRSTGVGREGLGDQ
ncbi:MAG: 4-(cytidine 5'-diphospho)-2-C-methyl-D-erythritol kinase [Acidimicrobiia bacterium]